MRDKGGSDCSEHDKRGLDRRPTRSLMKKDGWMQYSQMRAIPDHVQSEWGQDG